MKPEIEKAMGQPKISMGEGRLIYIAGPYSDREGYKVTENIWHACRVAVRLWELGWYVFTPHLNTAHFEIYSSLPKEVYLEGDLKFLEMCDCVMMLKGWEQSAGAKRELEVAIEKGLSVFYE